MRYSPKQMRIGIMRRPGPATRCARLELELENKTILRDTLIWNDDDQPENARQ
jgi:hypothetical protein